jgi:hypothetical protein
MIQFLPSVTYHYLRAYHFSLWLFLFLGWVRVRRGRIELELFIASLVLFHLLSLSTFLPSEIRFSIPAIPLSLLWAGTGILELKRYLEKIKGANAEKAVWLLVTLVILSQLPHSLKPERRHRAEQKRIGLWLKQNTPAGAVIMSNSPQEAFYADREFMLLPSGVSGLGNRGKSYQEILQDAKAKGIQYILVDKNTSEKNPGFIESIQPAHLKEVYRKEDRGLVIYEVVY